MLTSSSCLNTNRNLTSDYNQSYFLFDSCSGISNIDTRNLALKNSKFKKEDLSNVFTVARSIYRKYSTAELVDEMFSYEKEYGIKSDKFFSLYQDNKLKESDDFLKSKVEKELLLFLNKYSNEGSREKFFVFPDNLKKIDYKRNSDNIFVVSYPSCKRDSFEEEDGFQIFEYSNVLGNYICLGNFSLELKIKALSKTKVSIIGYSYKYWFSKNSYKLISKDCPEKEINFNIRFDWDEGHSEEGLEYHVNFLHTMPRVKSSGMTISDFLVYLESHMFLLSTKVLHNLYSHIGLANR